MKITDEHLAALREAIQPYDTEARRVSYRNSRANGRIKAVDWNMRYRWDLLYLSGLKIGDGKGMTGLPLYAYLKDMHIDTALRQIVPDLDEAPKKD